MEKIKRQTFRGIEFIRLSDVPKDQYEEFSKWLTRDHIINIRIDRKIQKDCVQYSDYEHWFDNVRGGKSPSDENKTTDSNGKSIGLAFDR